MFEVRMPHMIIVDHRERQLFPVIHEENSDVGSAIAWVPYKANALYVAKALNDYQQKEREQRTTWADDDEVDAWDSQHQSMIDAEHQD
jgi:hypothetical protein